MPYKDKTKLAASRLKGTKKSADRRRAALDSIKLAAGCAECGYRKVAAALDFHHPDPDSKEFSPGNAVARYGMDRILREVEKCIVLCCRCHRELHDAENDS